MHGQHPPMSHEPLEAAYMRAYIAEAKRLEPIIPEEL